MENIWHLPITYKILVKAKLVSSKHEFLDSVKELNHKTSFSKYYFYLSTSSQKILSLKLCAI